MNLEKELKEIYHELENIEKENFSWKKVKELYNKFEEKYLNAKSEELTEEIEIGRLMFFGTMFEGTFSFMEALDRGEEMPPFQDGDLDFIQEIADKAPQMLEELRRKNPPGEEDKDFFAEKRKKNEQLKSFIQEQRKKQGYSFQPTNKPNPQEEKKIQDQQKEIDYLKKQLIELTKQIEELKKNQSNNPENNSPNPEITEKIEQLENQKQKIQSKLGQKQSQQKELKYKTNHPSQNAQPEKGFNWLYVVIPGGILLVIMGIIIAYLIGKRSKKE